LQAPCALIHGHLIAIAIETKPGLVTLPGFMLNQAKPVAELPLWRTIEQCGNKPGKQFTLRTNSQFGIDVAAMNTNGTRRDFQYSPNGSGATVATG